MSSDKWLKGAVESSEWSKGVIGLSPKVFELLPALPKGMFYDLEEVDQVGPYNENLRRVVIRVELAQVDPDFDK